MSSVNVLRKASMSKRSGRNAASTSSITGVAVFTSTPAHEQPPAPHTSAVTAAQVASRVPGAYQPAQTSVAEAERERSQQALPPVPSDPSSPVAPTTSRAPAHTVIVEPSQNYAPREGDRDVQDPPPQYSDKPSKSRNGNEALAYGYDNRSHSTKDRSGSGHMGMIKRFGASLLQPAAEPRRESRSERSQRTDRRDRTDYGYETDTERYKRERNELRAQIHDMESINQSNQCTIRQLQEALDKEQERVERTKRSASLLETTMDNKEIFLGPQARNDDEVRTMFGSILSSIKTWSNNFNAGQTNAFQEELMPEYQRVAPLYTQLAYLEQMVQEKKMKRLFVRGWTTYVMTNVLFRTLEPLGGLNADIWMGQNTARNFALLEDELWRTDRNLISHRAFNDWRAFTADLISKSLSGDSKKSEENTQDAVLDAVAKVMDLVKPWCITNEHDALRGYADKLQKIFLQAVDLAKFFRRQRALWSIRFPSRPILSGLPETAAPLTFDPTCMRDDKGDYEDTRMDSRGKQKYVDIVISPALWKRGNTNGERFEREEAAVPAVVVLRAG